MVYLQRKETPVLTSGKTLYLLMKAIMVIALTWLVHWSLNPLLISVVICLFLVMNAVSKNYQWHCDDLLFLAICLFIWSYAWKRAKDASPFIDISRSSGAWAQPVDFVDPSDALKRQRRRRTPAAYSPGAYLTKTEVEPDNYLPDVNELENLPVHFKRELDYLECRGFIKKS